MKLKSFILCLFIGLSLSCNTSNYSKISCDFDSIYLKGVKDGEEGLNFSESLAKMCAGQSKSFAKKTYLKGQKIGLKNFCTFDRGQKRALMKLDSEPLCSDYSNYNDGFSVSVKSHCSKELAILDGKSLSPSNLNCLESPNYKNAFYLEVSKVCNKKMAYQQGYKSIPLSPYCLELENKSELLTSYNLGLQNHNKLATQQLEKKADTLSKQLKILKQTEPKSEAQKNSLSQRIDKISKEFLKTKHALEQKKSKL